VIQSPFTVFPGVGIYQRDLLNAGVIVHTYNPHIGSFLPSLGSSTNQSLLGDPGADIVMKSDERKTFVNAGDKAGPISEATVNVRVADNPPIGSAVSLNSPMRSGYSHRKAVMGWMLKARLAGM
jgi:hypothetical protein